MPAKNYAAEGFTDRIKNAVDRIFCCRTSTDIAHRRFYESSEDTTKAGHPNPFIIFDDKFADHFIFEDANQKWKRVSSGVNKSNVSAHDQKLPSVHQDSGNGVTTVTQEDSGNSLENESGYGRSVNDSRASSISSIFVTVGKDSFRDSYKIQIQTKTKCWRVSRTKSEFIDIGKLLQEKHTYTSTIITGGESLTVKALHDFVRNLLGDEEAKKIPEVAVFLKLNVGLSNTVTRPRERFCTVPEVSENDVVSDHNDPNIQNNKGGKNLVENQTCKSDTIERNTASKTSYENQQKEISPSDFEFVSVIGKGSFGRVMLARRIDSNQIFAIKVLRKQMISKRKDVDHVLSERSVLEKVLQHPYLVQLQYAFTTYTKIFFVLNYVNGGELFYHLQKERTFSESRSKFYAAEICCALTYMHSKGIIYRDLKPENILLDKYGHIALTDFGLSKENMVSAASTTKTFCGTPEYLAPEILLKLPYTRSVDWWTLGIVLYEMLYGLPPFYSRDTSIMYLNILTKPIRLRPTASLRAREILRALLIKNPLKRLGSDAKDGQEIMSHKFFSEIKWSLVESRQMTPPFVPIVAGDSDISNIDPLFTREKMSLLEEGSPGLSTGEIDLDIAFDDFFYSRD